MSKPSQFIVTTDFTSMKNEANTGIITVTVPSSVVISGGGTYQKYVDITIGTAGSVNRGMIASSKDGNEFYSCLVYNAQRNGVESGVSSSYNLFALFTRISPSVVRATVFIPNPYSGTLTGASGAEIISFKINTFVAPF